MSDPVKPAAAKVKVVELATDPGLIILYDVEAVHIALGQANSPVTQGATPGQSLDHIKQYVYTRVMSTPLSDKEHTVRKCDALGVQPEFFPELFRRLPADTFRAVIDHLNEIFIRANHPVARWSVNAAASAHDQLLPPTDRWGLGAAISLILTNGRVKQSSLVGKPASVPYVYYSITTEFNCLVSTPF